jgi:hypothetical protein
MKIIDATLHWYIWLYANGYIKLGRLEDFYVRRLEDFINRPETTDIISQLELELAEMSVGLQTEEELKNNLKIMLKESLSEF